MSHVELKFWKREPASAQLSAGLSALVHVLLIGGWVMATHPRFNPPSEAPATPIFYFPPPNPGPARSEAVEAIRYVELVPEGAGAGFGGEGLGLELDLGPADAADDRGNAGVDSVAAAESAPSDGVDSVFTVIEVDYEAERLPESAAPAYPPDLLLRRVTGQAIVQFVVDTTGRADPASFVVVVTSHPGFAQSVRDALPGMRFSTARIGSVKVRQLVELPFVFNIAEPLPPQPDTTDTAVAARRRPPAR